jgi:hypothetical protein
MNRILIIALLIFNVNIGFSQNFTGQWKGEFVDNSSIASWGSNRCDYVIDLEINGNNVSGYSYTYFTEDGKKYYTICKLDGFLDKKRKYIEVKETIRTKTNVPIDVTNSFQLHKLYWHKEGDNEVLEGKWVPAPGQGNKGTGFGTTILSKRLLSEISPLAKKLNSKKDPNNSPEKALLGMTKQRTVIKTPIKINPPMAKVTPKNTIKPIIKTPKPLVQVPVAIAKNDTSAKPSIIAKVITPKNLPTGFEKRSNNILQTVNVENETVKIELYDNGDIDGDSVSLFYNGKVLLAHKKLTTQSITLELPVNNDEVNELVMYADNLGTIPPNTALMIVTDGNKRYEVRVTSDLKKSGAIRFVHTKKE